MGRRLYVGYVETVGALREAPLQEIPTRTVVERCGCKSKEEFLKYVNARVKKGERYVLAYVWVSKDAKGKEKLHAHGLQLFRDSDGIVKVYNGQTNNYSTLKAFCKPSNMIFEHKIYGDMSPQLLRVDNLGFNLKLSGKILFKKIRGS